MRNQFKNPLCSILLADRRLVEVSYEGGEKGGHARRLRNFGLEVEKDKVSERCLCRQSPPNGAAGHLSTEHKIWSTYSRGSTCHECHVVRINSQTGGGFVAVRSGKLNSATRVVG